MSDLVPDAGLSIGDDGDGTSDRQRESTVDDFAEGEPCTGVCVDSSIVSFSCVLLVLVGPVKV